jgi:hypothetical protein
MKYLTYNPNLIASKALLQLIYLFVHASTALCWTLTAFKFLNPITVGRTPWTGMSPSQGRYLHTEQHRHRINAHRHPCLEWDSNPPPQCSSGEGCSCPRPRGHCDRRYNLFGCLEIMTVFTGNSVRVQHILLPSIVVNVK